MRVAPRSLAAVTAALLVLCACSAPSPAHTPDATPTTAEPYSACLVGDVSAAGLAADAAAGLADAEGSGVRTEARLDSEDPTADIEDFAASCDLVIGVGPALADTVATAAVAHPDADFALVGAVFEDDSGAVEYPNAKPLDFDTAGGAFLAGYLAAGMSSGGVVAAFGSTPDETTFEALDGFAAGVAGYNQAKGTKVTALGWDPATRSGSFVGDGITGEDLTTAFVDQGADIFFLAASPSDLGSAAAKDGVMAIGLGDDWIGADAPAPVLTTVAENAGALVDDLVTDAASGAFTPEPVTGAVANGGVSLSPFGDLDEAVPAELKDEVDELTRQIASGELKVVTPEPS